MAEPDCASVEEFEAGARLGFGDGEVAGGVQGGSLNAETELDFEGEVTAFGEAHRPSFSSAETRDLARAAVEVGICDLLSLKDSSGWRCSESLKAAEPHDSWFKKSPWDLFLPAKSRSCTSVDMARRDIGRLPHTSNCEEMERTKQAGRMCGKA
jgi:hypothetical protein